MNVCFKVVKIWGERWRCVSHHQADACTITWLIWLIELPLIFLCIYFLIYIFIINVFTGHINTAWHKTPINTGWKKAGLEFNNFLFNCHFQQSSCDWVVNIFYFLLKTHFSVCFLKKNIMVQNYTKVITP